MLQVATQVAAIRNVMLSITFMISSLVSGAILEQMTFPLGYQVVFAIGAIGAAMSSYHLFFIKPLQTDPLPQPKPPSPDPGPSQAICKEPGNGPALGNLENALQ